MPTVYVLQEAPGRNLAPALQYGKLKVILPPGDISYKSEVTYNYLFKALKDFTCEDYIILMGAPRAIEAVGLVLPIILKGGPHQVLNWDRQCGMYVPSLMELPPAISKLLAHKGEPNGPTTRHVSGSTEELRGSETSPASTPADGRG